MDLHLNLILLKFCRIHISRKTRWHRWPLDWIWTSTKVRKLKKFDNVLWHVPPCDITGWCMPCSSTHAHGTVAVLYRFMGRFLCIVHVDPSTSGSWIDYKYCLFTCQQINHVVITSTSGLVHQWIPRSTSRLGTQTDLPLQMTPVDFQVNIKSWNTDSSTKRQWNICVWFSYHLSPPVLGFRRRGDTNGPPHALYMGISHSH